MCTNKHKTPTHIQVRQLLPYSHNSHNRRIWRPQRRFDRVCFCWRLIFYMVYALWQSTDLRGSVAINMSFKGSHAGKDCNQELIRRKMHTRHRFDRLDSVHSAEQKSFWFFTYWSGWPYSRRVWVSFWPCSTKWAMRGNLTECFSEVCARVCVFVLLSIQNLPCRFNVLSSADHVRESLISLLPLCTMPVGPSDAQNMAGNDCSTSTSSYIHTNPVACMYRHNERGYRGIWHHDVRRRGHQRVCHWVSAWAG